MWDFFFFFFGVERLELRQLSQAASRTSSSATTTTTTTTITFSILGIMSNDAATVLEDASSSHRVYIGDSIGCLRVVQCDPPSALPADFAGPSVRPLILPNFKSHSDQAVQRLATGVLGNDPSVVAMARRNATIDVVQVVNQTLPSSQPSTSAAPAAASELRANVLCTIRETHMKAGIQRFIGLAVGTDGIYSITSSGVFRFTPITITHGGEGEDDVAAELGEPRVLQTLPSPLQHASFYPASDPTHFCYGGEDVPLSLWHVATAVSDPPAAHADTAADMSVESIRADEAGLNSKQRKRKRQLEAKSKARELLWGEVWRAKNLPNDNLSLPRRANITATCILSLQPRSDGDEARGTEEAGGVDGQTFIAVGTKDGLVRVFQPGAASRRHVREARVVPSGQGSVKTLCASTAALDSRTGGVLFVGDTGSKLYALDWQTGAVVYSYNGMAQVGAVLGMAVLPTGNADAEALVSVSSDSLMRLHTTIPAAVAVPKQGESGAKGKVVWQKMIARATGQSVHATPTAVAWNQVVPAKIGSAGGQDDAVWENMQQIRSRANKKHDPNNDDHDEDDEQSESEEEPATRKSTRSGAKKPRS